MGRLLELIVVAVFLWLALESWVARISGARSQGRFGRRDGRPATAREASSASPPPSGPRPVADVTLVRCAACGTHIPQSRALAAPPRSAGKAVAAPSGAVVLYCSERCLREGRSAGEPAG
jgi:hypothetical protein